MLALASILPAGFLDQSQLQTRFCFDASPAARLSVLFRHHGGPGDAQLTHRIYSAEPPEFATTSGAMARIFGLTYVLAGGAVLPGRAADDAQRVEAGTLIQFTNVASQQPPIIPDPGCIECSVCLDSGTGERLIGDGAWDGSWTSATAGHCPPLLRAYHDLFSAIGDRAINHHGLRWRLFRLLELANAARDAHRPGARFVERAKRILDDHPEPSFGVAKAAELLDCTAGQFTRRFRAEVGISPARWQQRRRLEKAAEMLPYRPVHEVAALLGYTDPAVFSRQFRREMGIPPRDLAIQPSRRGPATGRRSGDRG